MVLSHPATQPGINRAIAWRAGLCARQVGLIGIRPLASVGPVGPIRRVAQRCARRQTGCAVLCSSILRNRRRARHNTQLCSNRLVTEAGLPAEGTAGCMSALLCHHVRDFRTGQMWNGGLRPVRRAVPALRSAHTRAAKPRACQDVVPFLCAAMGVSASLVPSDGSHGAPASTELLAANVQAPSRHAATRKSAQLHIPKTGGPLTQTVRDSSSLKRFSSRRLIAPA